MTDPSTCAETSAAENQYRAGAVPWSVGLVVFAFLLAVAPLARTLNIWNDESFTMHSSGGTFGYALHESLFFEVQPPCYFLAMQLWRRLDSSIFFARCFSMLCAALAILIVSRLSKRVLPALHPCWLTALFAFNPFVVWAAVEIRVYALVLLLSAVLLICFWDGYVSETPSRRSRWAYLITAWVSLYTFYYLGFNLLAGGVVLLGLKRWRSLWLYLGGMLLTGVGIIPIILLVPKQMSEHLGTVRSHIPLLSGVRFILWRIQDYVFPAIWDPSVLWRHWIVSIGILLLLGIFLWKWRALVSANVAAIWILMGTVAVCFLGIRNLTGDTLLEVRHTTPLFLPALIALVSILALDKKRRMVALWSAGMVVFYGTSLWGTYAPLAKRGDWKRVAAYLQASEAPDEPILVFTSTIKLSLSYYYSGLNEIVPLPRKSVFGNYDVRTYALADAGEITSALSRIGGPHMYAWLVTDYGCSYLGVNYHCDILDHYLDRYYSVEMDRVFFLSRLRLLRRRAGTFNPGSSDAPPYSSTSTGGNLEPQMGFIDRSGKVVIPAQFDEARPFSEGLAAVRKGNRFGFIDRSGHLVIPAQFSYVGQFSEGLTPARVSGKTGYLDPQGRWVIAPRFEDGSNFAQGLAVVRVGARSGYIDRTGRTVIAPQFEAAWDFSEGLAEVQLMGRYGYINPSGSMVIPAIYGDAGDLHEGLAVVRSAGKYGFIDRTGNFVIPPQFDFAHDFSGGIAAVRVKGKYGYIDKNGGWLVRPQYDGAEDFSDGMGQVRIGGKTGYVDETGREAIITQFDDSKNFSGGLAPVIDEDSGGYIDHRGKLVIPKQFREVNEFSESLAAVRMRK